MTCSFLIIKKMYNQYNGTARITTKCKAKNLGRVFWSIPCNHRTCCIRTSIERETPTTSSNNRIKAISSLCARQIFEIVFDFINIEATIS